MSAVYELTTVTPHEPVRRRYSRAEWLIYCEGYYRALAAALELMDWIVSEWATGERARRRIARAHRAAARRALGGQTGAARKVVGVLSDRRGEMIAQRPHDRTWNTETQHVVRTVVDAGDFEHIGSSDSSRIPTHAADEQGLGHREDDTLAPSAPSIQSEKQTP